MENDVQLRVLRIIAEILEKNEQEISLDASLDKDLNLDSLKQMTLFILLEDEFNRTMPPDDLIEIASVKDIIDFINRKLKEPAPT